MPSPTPNALLQWAVGHETETGGKMCSHNSLIKLKWELWDTAAAVLTLLLLTTGWSIIAGSAIAQEAFAEQTTVFLKCVYVHRTDYNLICLE